MTLAVVLSVALTVATLAVTAAGPAQGAAAPAKQADVFVDSIGVNTHIRFRDSAYNSQFPLLKSKLSALGVRHVRDTAVLYNDSNYNEFVYGRYRELAALGMRFTLSVDPRKENLNTIDQAKIAKIAQMAGPSLESFEGPNELDISGIAGWTTVLRNYQRDLYAAVNNNPSTSSVPVIGPSMGQSSHAAQVGDLSAYMDYGNMHPYPIGEHPGSPRLDNYSIPNTRHMTGNKPFMPTETGYHTASNWNGPHPGVSEKAMGKYVPRLFLEYFNRGIPRTYAYETLDDFPDPNGINREHNFGLLRNDGTEKPAYTGLKNLITLLEDPGPSFRPGSLEYSLGGDLENVHRTLLQKRDGRFYLILWQERPSYNLATEQDIPVEANRVTLTLGQPISKAATYLSNGSVAATKQYSAPKRMTVDVPDNPLVVEITPR